MKQSGSRVMTEGSTSSGGRTRIPTAIWRRRDPNAEETLMFWRSINNKQDGKGGEKTGPPRRCSKKRETSWEDEDADGESSPKRSLTTSSDARHRGRHAERTVCTPSQSRSVRQSGAVFELVKKQTEWRVVDRRDEENGLLLEGRTVLVFNGGDRKDPANRAPSMPPHNHEDGDTRHSQEDAAVVLLEC